ncbi:hypothetical protein BC749_101825 [Flavobacterium araucananum]|jgi:hypothetical protein|uniref:Uncharacterized protein n=1 Tax=Flavobacterium araucananum TaxID=946678 RepID=A0A227PJ02_9FLAO|nr:hypothetical protein [Flavobacterium araucananum]OXG09374.1 hypothetical protein B0A64_01010 [Flavobacterium araucananum]PWK02751.1 hypothetical protein BC749_101825 [Flavobacterium araucananum]
MIKNILNLDGAYLLSAYEQKSIQGGQPIQPSTCHCFCSNSHGSVSASCFTYCPDGSIPGLSEGSTGNCKFPFE